MTTADLNGCSLLGAAAACTALLGALRFALVSWRPGCGGRGARDAGHGLAAVCDVCRGSGRLRVPDTAPADWFTSR